MIAVADTYDVMTARDSYRDPVSSFEAIAELRRIAGTQLDAELRRDLRPACSPTRTSPTATARTPTSRRELALDRRIHDYVEQPAQRRRPRAPPPDAAA